MVNIAMIGHKRIPSREGGIEIVVDELATRMAAKGHKVIAYNRKGHNVAGAEFDGNVHSANKPFVYNGVRVVPVPTFEAKGLAALTSSFFATLKAIAARPDVIHYHAEGPCVSSVWRIGRAFARSLPFTVLTGSVPNGASSPPHISSSENVPQRNARMKS